MTKAEVAKLLALLRGAWPDQRVDADVIAAYHAALGDAPADIGDAAAREIIASSRFFPRPAELRERALALSPRPVKPAYTGRSRISIGVCGRCGKEAEALLSGKGYCGDHADEMLLAMGIDVEQVKMEATA